MEKRQAFVPSRLLILVNLNEKVIYSGQLDRGESCEYSSLSKLAAKD